MKQVKLVILVEGDPKDPLDEPDVQDTAGEAVMSS